MDKELKIKLSEAAQKEFRNLSREQKDELLEGLGTNNNVLWQTLKGTKLVGASRAMKIEKILKRPGLAARIRPDVFGGV